MRGVAVERCLFSPLIAAAFIAALLQCIPRPLQAADEVLLVGGARKTGELRTVPEGVAVTQGKKEEVFSWAKIDWIVIRSPNFVFRTRITPERTRYYAETMELFAAALASTFKFKVPNRHGWTRQVRIFRDEREYAKYDLESTGTTSDSCGYFFVDRKNQVEEVVVHDMARDPAETFDTLLHEGTHLMLHLWGKAKDFDFPVWIDEGMAEYFGGSTYRPSARSLRKVFTQGCLKPWRWLSIVEQLQKGEAAPLEQLLILNRSEFDTKHYAQSWSLIHFLANYRKGVFAPYLMNYCQELMRTVKEGKRAAKLFNEIFVRSLPDFENAWKAYVRELAPAAAEDRLALADAYEQDGEADKSLSAVEPLLKADPDDYRGLVIKARALSWKGAYTEAFAQLERAAGLQPEYPFLLRTSAVLSFEADRWPEALKAYAAYFALEPFDLVASVEYVKCLLRSPAPHRDPAKARAVGEKVLEYHRDWQLLDFVGDSALELEDYRRARSSSRKRSGSRPRTSPPREARARSRTR